jgi:hypothetical protein
MKRVGIIALVALALGTGATAAQASVKWPARCQNFTCVTKHLNALHQQALKANRVALVNYLYKCGVEFPQTLDSSEYFFLTPSGSTPDVWALGDGCNTDPASVQHTATRRVRGTTPLAFFATP